MNPVRLGYVAMVWPSSTIHTKVNAQQRSLHRMHNAGRLESLLTTQCVTDGEGDDWIRFGASSSVKLRRSGRLHSVANLLYGYPGVYDIISKELLTAEMEVLYIRKPPVFAPISVRFLRGLRRRGIRVVLEIPTYPYDREWRTGSLQARLDRQARRDLSGAVDLIATLSDDAQIFGVPCVNIDNCADDFDLPTIESAETEGIRATVVAALEPWHRVDRVVSALLESWSQGDTRISRLNIVGDGPLRGELERMAGLNPELGRRIVFHGAVYGARLSAIFDETDLGVGNLETTEDRGLSAAKALKHREYAARGLPFVYGLSDSSFEHSPYALRVSDDPLDVNVIVEWFRGICLTRSAIAADAARFRWESQFELVLAALDRDAGGR